jgi:hypothetical protein
MDKKQNKIWNEIKEKFSLGDKAKLIQYRNLREFRYFTIERINPNHIIELYGKLKNGNPKKEVCLNVHVGKIIIPYMSLIIFMYSYSTIEFINFFMLIMSMLSISISLFYVCNSINLVRLCYDCIDRRYSRSYKLRFRENFVFN